MKKKDIYFQVDKSNMKEFYDVISTNVRKIRVDSKYSQLDLALAIGIKSASYISNCENLNKKEHFNLENLYLIAKVLETTVSDLIEEHN